MLESAKAVRKDERKTVKLASDIALIVTMPESAKAVSEDERKFAKLASDMQKCDYQRKSALLYSFIVEKPKS